MGGVGLIELVILLVIGLLILGGIVGAAMVGFAAFGGKRSGGAVDHKRAPCRECGELVAIDQKTCPKCGAAA